MRANAATALDHPTYREDGMTMTDTIPRAPTEAQAARARPCPLCEAPPGAPCQAKPEADHLARYLDAYVAGKLSRAYMAAVVGELVVIDRAVMIPARVS
jgi:hypothetical protein